MRRHDEVSVFWRSEEGRQGWYYRVQIDGQPMKRSTGVTKHTEAGRKEALRAAEKLAAALRSRDEHKIAAAVKRPGYAKCGEVAEIYREHGPAASVTKSLSRFVAFVREVTGRQDWEEQSTHLVLMASVMRAWIATQKKAGRSESGIHTDVQTIKSIVARKRFYLFENLKLPDLADFWAVSGGSATTEGYQPIDRTALRRMDRAARIPLRRRDPRAWAVYWLMRKAGLRNDEVQYLKWSWVDWQPDGTADLVLIKREEWTPKGRSGRVPMRARMLRLIKAALGEGEYVLPRTSPTDAYNVTHYGINDFVRLYIPDGEKGAYNLRKEYGAQIAARDGIEVASRLLRHRDIQTTFNHYHNLINRPKPL